MKHTFINAIIIAGLSAMLVGCQEEIEFNDIVKDNALVIENTREEDKLYEGYNKALLERFDIDFRVITTSSKQDVNTFSNKEFKNAQKKSRSKSGKALLLVINTEQDRVRLEVSMALEPIYTDAFVSYVERKGMIPYLRERKIGDGVYMMTELAYDRAVEAVDGKEFMPPMKSKSIGGGAKEKAHIGVSDPDAKKGGFVKSHQRDTPEDVMKKYMKANEDHNKNPDLDIYTDTTKKFFSEWVVTDINQDHEVENVAKCEKLNKIIYNKKRTHAVLAVLPYDKNRACSPYFFKKEEGNWKLDIASMAQMLRFNQSMQMHFDKEKRLEKEGMYYAFAFDGYGFDSNGYPFLPKEVHPDWKKYRWGYTCGYWFYPKDKNRVKTEPENVIRCYIQDYAYGMPSNVRLGLDVKDSIMAVGEGTNRIDNVTNKQFMDYMKNVPSGSTATVEVKREGKIIVRRGVAP